MLKRLKSARRASPFVKDKTFAISPANSTLGHLSGIFVGGTHSFGNTEEKAKIKVLGTRQRGIPSMPPFDHKTGEGFVESVLGDYCDALINRKARANLLVFENLGGFSPHSARRLRRHGRAAATLGQDSTDYSRSYTARSFVPHFSQRISSGSVMHGAAGIIKCLGKLRAERLEARAAGRFA